jgi:hypothetical protein
MKIPSLFYGHASIAKSRARKLAKLIVKSGDFDAFELEPCLDTSEVDGLILAAPEVTPPWLENFHCYALGSALVNIAGVPDRSILMRDWLLWCLKEEWRFVFVLGHDSRDGMRTLERSLLQQYVDASIRYWPGLVAEGSRFGPSSNDSGDLWDAWTNLKFALANMGVPTKEVIAGSPEGPAGLLKYINHGKLDA